MYINIKREDLKPYVDINIGDIVIYQNANGYFYKGVVETKLQWHTMWLMRPPNDKKIGIRCNFNGLVLVLQKNELFQINAEI